MATHGWEVKHCSDVGLSLLLNTDNYIDYLIHRDGIYEDYTLRAISELLGSGLKNFVDVGSNIGLMSLYVARNFPDVSIAAFEPIPENILQQRVNMLINGLDYPLFEFALSDREEELTLYKGKHDNRGADWGKFNSGMPSIVLDEFRDPDAAVRVKATSFEAALGTRLTQMNIDEGTVVKIDVEGAEMKVLSGMSNLLNSNASVALIVELLHDRYPESCAGVEALASDRGFQMRPIHPATGEYVLIR